MSLSASAFLIWSLADNLEAVVRWLAHLLMLKQIVYRGIALQIVRSCHHLQTVFAEIDLFYPVLVMRQVEQSRTLATCSILLFFF